MAKEKNQFVCSSCGHIEYQWMGHCSRCEEWNSFVEESQSPKKESKGDTTEPQKIADVLEVSYERVETGVREFDRVLGGGLVKGSLVLVGGEPGIGKSTLLMEICGRLSGLFSGESILYVSGEESEAQVADRSRRLGVNGKNIFVYNETSWEKIKANLKKLNSKYLVLDSIQTTTSENIQATPGTVSQVKEVTYEVLNHCKANGITAIIIGHVTKEGSIAGPKVLEHMVDAVVYFEGDQLGQYRILRSIKNRFGNTNEVGIFEMTERGLKEVVNPSNYFLDLLSSDSYGRSLSCIVEGSRTLFIETQALVIENKNGFGRRTAQGIDSSSLAMLVAIVEKYFEATLAFSDIYTNIIGGIKIKTREADLAIIAATLSSLRKTPIEKDCVLLGEVGLTGEVRSIPMPEMRIKEMEQLKYKTLITSKRIAEDFKGKGSLEIIGIEKIVELNNFLFK